MLLDLASQVSTLEDYDTGQKLSASFQDKATQAPIYVAPKNLCEEYLQGLFQKALNTSQVSINSDFFALGGTSLMGALLLAEISQFYSIHITIDWLFQHPTIQKLAKAITAALKKAHNESIAIPSKSSLEQLIPLSYAQQRIWFLNKLHPHSSLYNAFIALELQGLVNATAINRAFSCLVDRHECLRTTFKMIHGTPYQMIHPTITNPYSIKIQDVEGFSENDLREMAYNIAQKPFDLLTGPLLDITLLTQSNHSYLFFSSHHILIDGSSFNILIREFSTLYTAYVENAEPLLEPIKIQYADFAVWQRQWLQGEVFHKQKTYWMNKLADLPDLNFPTDYNRTAEMSTAGKRIPFTLDKALLNQLRELSQKMNVTLFTTLMTCYAILLNKYTNKKDILIGTAVAGRQYPGVENIVGHFVNILLLRFDLNNNPRFFDLISRNHSVIIEAYTHQDLPFEEIVKEFSLQRNATENPLAQMMLVFQEGIFEYVQLPDIKVKRVFSDNDQLILLADYDNSKLDMTMDLQVTEHGLEGLVEYNCHLFKEETIQSFIEHFSNILISVCNNSEQCCSDISPLNASEYRKIVIDWNKTTAKFPAKNTVVQLFEEQVLQQPDAIALIYDDEQMTYRLLNQRANQLASYFQSRHLRPQMSVALFLDRNFDLIASILALFKIGAVWVPISTNMPNDYIDHLLSDSSAQYIVTQLRHHERIAEFNGHQYLKLLTVDVSTVPENHQSDRNPQLGIMPEHTACLVYTSGSTGKPKGVLLTHRGLLNTIFAQIDYLKINSNSRVLQWASINFDAVLWDIFGALGAGATLCLVSDEDILNTHRLTEIIYNQAINLWTVTPSYLSTLANADLPNLQTLVVAGEPCHQPLAKRWGVGRRLINAYGLTETSICSVMGTWHACEDMMTLGKPIANTQVYVLNPEGQPTPIGVSGELYIVGLGVAKGYHRRSELTKERFLFNPFNLLCSDSKMLKTGDWVRWLPDGRLQYVGRLDDVATIRGIRTDLNSITSVLQEHPLVAQATVTVKSYSLSDQRIIAFIVLRSNLENHGGCVLNTQHFSHWQALYENLYTHNESSTVEGWESSYTRQPIPPEEMQEWMDKTAEKILTLPLKKC